jgi:hypothetical protein
MRQLTAEDISKVSGGMMNRGEGRPSPAGFSRPALLAAAP